MSTIPNKFFLRVIQKRFLKTLPTFSSSPPFPPPSSSSSFTVEYLTRSCGLPLVSAIATSQKFQLDENKSPVHNSVITFLKSQEFSDAHIAKVITKYPRILQSKVDTKLKPKIQCLIDNGFSGALLPELIVQNPSILRRSLSSNLKSLDLLKKYLGSDDNVIAAVKSTPRLLTFDLKVTLQPIVELLISEGVPIAIIFRLIMSKSRTLLQKVDSFVHAIETVKKLGLKPSAPMFSYAIIVMVSMSESTWDRKVDIFKSLGWSEEDIKYAFISHPYCLGVSENKIRSIMDFYVNTMKVEPAVIVACPKLLMYSLNNRIRPRYNVVKILMSKKLFNEGRKLVWLIQLPEKRFLEDFVVKHLDKVPNLMEVYRCTIPTSEMSIVANKFCLSRKRKKLDSII